MGVKKKIGEPLLLAEAGEESEGVECLSQVRSVCSSIVDFLKRWHRKRIQQWLLRLHALSNKLLGWLRNSIFAWSEFWLVLAIVLFMLADVVLLVKGMEWITELTKGSIVQIQHSSLKGIDTEFTDMIAPIVRATIFFVLMFLPGSILALIVERRQKQRIA